MSYILEALKKLEQKRQQEGGPNLLTFQTDTPQTSKGRSRWFYALFAALLLNAAAISWWIVARQPTERRAAVQPQVISEAVPEKAISATSDVPADNRGPHTNMLDDKKAQQARGVSGPAGRAIAKKMETVSGSAPHLSADSEQPSVVKRAAANNQLSPSLQARTVVKPQLNGRVFRLNELPADVRNSLPELKMSIHLYNAEPQARFAKINDRTLHEGESLVEGLKVEQIRPDGVVFGYQGLRFQLGINENR